jgi:hypothetical protein
LIWRFAIFLVFQSRHNFKSAYDGIKWRNNEEDFKGGVKVKRVTPWLMPECDS